MGTDRLSSFYKVGSRLSSLVSIMKFFTFLFFVGFSAAAYIKRDAEAEADPSGHITGGISSAPVCNETPVRECKPRHIENPRKVCQTVYDTHEDTVVTEHCEEIVTTQCTTTSQSATQHSEVVDQFTRLVETGVPRAIDHSAHAVVGHAVAGPAVVGHALAGPAVVGQAFAGPAIVDHAITGSGVVGHDVGGFAIADHAVASSAVVGHAVAGPAVVGHAVSGPAVVGQTVTGSGVVGHDVGGLSVGGASFGIGHHFKREADAFNVHAAGHVAPVAEHTSAPVCNSVPERRCNKVPNSTPRQVARTVCDTVVDITIIEDCQETVTTVCQQTSTAHSSSSAVVGHDTQVVATGVDEAFHGTVATGPTVHGHATISHGIV